MRVLVLVWFGNDVIQSQMDNKRQSLHQVWKHTWYFCGPIHMNRHVKVM